MKRFLWGVQAAAILVFSFPFSLLPVKGGELLGLLLYYVWKSRRAIAIDNLRKCVDLGVLSLAQSPEEVIRENFRNLGRSFIEIIKIYYGTGRTILEKTVIKGMEHFEKARAKGKGVFLITGHCGNWELLAILASYRVAPLSVVVRPLNNPYLNTFLVKARSRFGNRLIDKKGALRAILGTLKDGGFVGILMDQAVLQDEGYVIEFLGRGAWTTKMPALLARKTGAPAVAAFIRRTESGHEITVHPEISLSSNSNQDEAVREDTKRFSSFIEDYIKENPSQWLWMHRRWKRAPEEAQALETSMAGGRK
ncbi:MAG: lysophospholipid acyltransferase family protein [Nitrospirae bacterium]|nr:lysophospholipid acyltransferase family protein [Nitrospirota bacterium]MCL5422755.1 lysophospholipid acyltransferase family protein [Nitrospirota bacterium]